MIYDLSCRYKATLICSRRLALYSRVLIGPLTSVHERTNDFVYSTRNVLDCDQSNYSLRIIFSIHFTPEPNTKWIGWPLCRDMDIAIRNSNFPKCEAVIGRSTVYTWTLLYTPLLVNKDFHILLFAMLGTLRSSRVVKKLIAPIAATYVLNFSTAIKNGRVLLKVLCAT